MKIILILLVISLQSVFAAKDKVTVFEDPSSTEGEISTEKINTSPNPVPHQSDSSQGTIRENGSLMQKQEQPPFEVGPYDKDGKYTLPKKDTTEEVP